MNCQHCQTLLLDHLGESDHSADELAAAGLATRSGRSHVHVLFHARIMFPITDMNDEILGFAGLATHLGPSWPLWLTSPDEGGFDASSAFTALPTTTMRPCASTVMSVTEARNASFSTWPLVPKLGSGLPSGRYRWRWTWEEVACRP